MTQDQFEFARLAMENLMGYTPIEILEAENMTGGKSWHNFPMLIGMDKDGDFTGETVDAPDHYKDTLRWFRDLTDLSSVAVRRFISAQLRNPTGQAIVIHNTFPIGFKVGVTLGMAYYGGVLEAFDVNVEDWALTMGYFRMYSDQVSGKTGMAVKTEFPISGDHQVKQDKLIAPFVIKPGETVQFEFFGDPLYEKAAMVFLTKGIAAAGAIMKGLELVEEVAVEEAPESPYFD